jgi:hypothetical protein
MSDTIQDELRYMAGWGAQAFVLAWEDNPGLPPIERGRSLLRCAASLIDDLTRERDEALSMAMIQAGRGDALAIEVARLREALTRSRATALRDALGEVARWTADMMERVDRAEPASEEVEPR